MTTTTLTRINDLRNRVAALRDLGPAMSYLVARNFPHIGITAAEFSRHDWDDDVFAGDDLALIEDVVRHAESLGGEEGACDLIEACEGAWAA